MVIEGIVKKCQIREGKSKAGNDFKVAEFIVEFKEYPTDKQYDQVALEAWQETIVENIKEGMCVRAVISHKTHEYNGRTFNDIKLEEIHAVKRQAQVMTSQYAVAANMAEMHDNTPAGANVPTAEPAAEDPDDLPF